MLRAAQLQVRRAGRGGGGELVELAAQRANPRRQAERAQGAAHRRAARQVCALHYTRGRLLALLLTRRPGRAGPVRSRPHCYTIQTSVHVRRLINVIYQNTPTLPAGARQVPLPIRYHASNLPFKQVCTASARTLLYTWAGHTKKGP